MEMDMDTSVGEPAAEETKVLSMEAIACHNSQMTSRRQVEKQPPPPTQTPTMTPPTIQAPPKLQKQESRISGKTHNSSHAIRSTKTQLQLRNKNLLDVKDRKSDDGSARSSSSHKTPPDRLRVPATRGLQTMMMLKKKMSKWRTSRMSQVSMGSKTKSIIVLENTYKMEPTDDKKFCSWKVHQVVEETLAQYLDPLECYNPHKSAALSRFLSEEIKSRVKALNYQRYKLATHVVIGQNMEQGLQVASRAVWDPEVDDRATVTYKRADIFAVANVFATYFE